MQTIFQPGCRTWQIAGLNPHLREMETTLEHPTRVSRRDHKVRTNILFAENTIAHLVQVLECFLVQ